jgi:hypothetical protein
MKKTFSLSVLLILLALISTTSGCKPHQPPAPSQEMEIHSAETSIKQGDFLKAEQILSSPVSSVAYGTGTYLFALTETALGKKLDTRHLSILAPDKRQHILSILALFSPQDVLDYLHSLQSVSPRDAEAGVTALRIQNQNPNEISKQYSWLFPTSAFEKAMDNISLPNIKQPLPIFREAVKTLVANTQRLRSELSDALVNQPPKAQMRILEKNRILEERTGKFLKTVPPPPALPHARVVEYKKGLEKIGQEFLEQSTKVAAREKQIEESIRQDTVAEKVSLPAKVDMNKWFWPQGFSGGQSGYAALNKAISEKNYVGAVIVADLSRSDLLKDDANYYSVRAGALLLQSQDDPMKRFVLNELTVAKQTPLITQWSTLGQPR